VTIWLTRYLTTDIKSAPVPFFIRPITNGIASRVQASFLNDQFDLHYRFIEGQLATSPDGGEFLCGKELTGADIMMSFPLDAANGRSGVKKENFPKAFAYVAKMYERDAYKRATQKIIEAEGEFKTTL
jgi:glutathione S-transferase